MTMTILTALGALIAALLSGALAAPTQETAARAVRRAIWSGRAMPQTRSFGRRC
jgi:capsid protein